MLYPHVPLLVGESPRGGHRRSPAPRESYPPLVGASSVFGGHLEPCFKRCRPTASPTAIVRNLVKAAKVVGFLFEVRYSVFVGHIPERSNHRKKGCLAGAVVAYEYRQRRQPRILALAKAAVVL